MPTFDFNLTAVDIVRLSLQNIGALEEEEELSAAQISDGIKYLNLLIKTWQKQGAHLWRKREGVLPLTQGQFKYLLGPNGDRSALEDDFIETRMDGAQSSGATVITVDDTTGMAAADEIGIFINTSLRQWTTIVSVDDSTTLTITDGLVADTNDNATVFTFTERIQRPLRLLHGRRRAGPDTVSEIPTFPLTHNYYYDLTTRSTASGLPVEHQYEPKLNEGELFLWPVPSSVDFLFKFTFTQPFGDIDTNSDFTDFPQEWLDPLLWNLSKKEMHSYRLPIAERNEIKEEANSSLAMALEFDREYAPTRIMPDLRGHG